MGGGERMLDKDASHPVKDEPRGFKLQASRFAKSLPTMTTPTQSIRTQRSGLKVVTTTLYFNRGAGRINGHYTYNVKVHIDSKKKALSVKKAIPENVFLERYIEDSEMWHWVRQG